MGYMYVVVVYYSSTRGTIVGCGFDTWMDSSPAHQDWLQITYEHDRARSIFGCWFGAHLSNFLLLWSANQFQCRQNRVLSEVKRDGGKLKCREICSSATNLSMSSKRKIVYHVLDWRNLESIGILIMTFVKTLFSFLVMRHA
jgi:hypothetical protein